MPEEEGLGRGLLDYRRMPIEKESPEERGYGNIRHNLTESSIADTRFSDLEADLQELVFSYAPHRGDVLLRRLIARDALREEEVLVTPGASSALFLVATSLLRPGDHVVVQHPNYATLIETPRAMGCRCEFLRLSFEEGFALNLERLRGLLRDDTRLLSITYPHNPTGTTIDKGELCEILDLVESRGCFLLVDETYREMTFGEKPPVAASLSPRAISVSSMSKSYGLPGIRIGWVLSQDARLVERFLAAKEQIFICNSVLDEGIALHFLENRGRFLPKMRARLLENFETMKSWMGKSEYLEWVEPGGGCVCFPRMDSRIDTEKFYRTLNEKYGTYVGPGDWFETDRRFMRIGYGWPDKDELEGGLDCITRSLEEAGL